MSLMIVPKVGDRVVVSRPTKMFVNGFDGQTSDVHVGEVGEVMEVTSYVVGEGRYVKVKLTEKFFGYIHESNLNKV